MNTDKPDDGLRAAVNAAAPREAAPPALADRIRGAIDADEAAPPAARPKWRRRGQPLRAFSWTSLAAAAALALAGGYQWGGLNARSRFVTEEAVAAHVRSLEPGHLFDVASTDQHTVEPWFNGKTDFSPPVADLAGQDYPLVGGRLDRLGGHAAAALVYRRHQHAINLFIWPGRPDGPERASLDGYQTCAWSTGDFAFLAVSDLPAAELDHFVEAYRAAMH